MTKYTITEKAPTSEDYNTLRESAGWFPIKPDIAAASLENSIYSICAIIDNQTIGTARIIGDAGINYYIQDLIVLPEFQNRGIGTALFSIIIEYLKNNAPDNSFIGLMAAKGKEAFYEKFDFIKRPGDNFGPGMCLIMQK